MSNDWIEWNGGECPVAGDVVVDVKRRDGQVSQADRFSEWRWSHWPDHSDIVAYRVVCTGGWVEWSGGVEPPIPEGAVWVRFRDGEEAEDLACALDWVHRGRAADIIAYRLAEPSQLPEGNWDADSALTRQPGGTHYSDAKIQPIEFIEANKLGFLEGSICKRITRHNHPTGKGREDIEKIIHEARLLLELRYGVTA